MGYNTVAVFLNDSLDVGAKDPTLGERIQDASRNWLARHRGGGLSWSARSNNCSASYGSIISQDHADGYQVCIVHGNMGWRADNAEYDKYLGWQALDAMKDCLERNGYRVVKKREPRVSKGFVDASE